MNAGGGEVWGDEEVRASPKQTFRRQGLFGGDIDGSAGNGTGLGGLGEGGFVDEGTAGDVDEVGGFLHYGKFGRADEVKGVVRFGRGEDDVVGFGECLVKFRFRINFQDVFML